ncbi:hypothetical protein WBP06_04035 [Novosphingobium sp. BL-8H]|uniref:hypothetical protein n=1 Tax=Novosphingobium sp. BL-8H TaxID=3127640 RepID=UPI003757CDEC
MAIVELALEQLEAGTLANAFCGGAVAALIKRNSIVGQLWNRLLRDTPERMPWETPLSTMAENHHGTGSITESIGDVIYFQTNFHGHIARKFEIIRHGDRLSTRPDGFTQDGRILSPAADLVADCWLLSSRILIAMTMPAVRPPDYRVAVQRIKYLHDAAALDATTAMFRNSLGRWGKLGFAMDVARASAAGPFSTKVIADLFGVVGAMPLISAPLRGINSRLAKRGTVNGLEEGQQLIEMPHYDSRYFSAICGSRETIRTQVHAAGEWIDLPISPDTMAIFPGRLAKRQFGIPATLHRVIQCEALAADRLPSEAARSHNTTLLLGAK